MHPFIEILLLLAIAGLIVYLIERFVPMGEPIRTIFRVLVGVFAIVWLLDVLGVSNVSGCHGRSGDSVLDGR